MQREMDVELAAWERIKSELLTQYPDLDDETLFDTLDGETDLQEACLKVLRSAEEDKMLIEGIKARKAELDERKARFDRRIEAKRHAVTNIMDRAGIKKFEAPDMTVSVRAVAPSLVLPDTVDLPPEYVNQELVLKPNRNAIKDAISAGKEVPGVTLTNGGISITVRTK